MSHNVHYVQLGSFELPILNVNAGLGSAALESVPARGLIGDSTKEGPSARSRWGLSFLARRSPRMTNWVEPSLVTFKSPRAPKWRRREALTSAQAQTDK